MYFCAAVLYLCIVSHLLYSGKFSVLVLFCNHLVNIS